MMASICGEATGTSSHESNEAFSHDGEAGHRGCTSGSRTPRLDNAFSTTLTSSSKAGHPANGSEAAMILDEGTFGGGTMDFSSKKRTLCLEALLDPD